VARLLGLRVRVPPRAKMSVYCECCLVSGRGFWVQSSPTEWGVSECDREASVMRAPWPNRGCPALKKKTKYKLPFLYLISASSLLWLASYMTHTELHSKGKPSLTFKTAVIRTNFRLRPRMT